MQAEHSTAARSSAPVPELHSPSERPPEDCNGWLSVIVPVHNDPENLSYALEGLLASGLEKVEIIVVDDGSTDDTVQVARRFGVHVHEVSQRSGPAAARNVGAALARGEYLAFFDSDVVIAADTLEQMADVLRHNPSIDAVFGSYDTSPNAPNVLSQYRNLLHHSTHQDAREEASTFWSGCGAIRRAVFEAVGGFRADYTQPCIEDIELGARLRKAGCRVVLNKNIQVQHRKHWTFFNMIRTDLFGRAIPWTRLIFRERSLTNDLNLKMSNRINTVLAFSLLAAFMIGAWHINWLVLLAAAVVLAIVLIDNWSFDRRVPTAVRVAACFAVPFLGGAIAYAWPLWAALVASVLAIFVALDYRFYRLLARERKLLFPFLVLPVHLIYYLNCGFGFAAGAVVYFWRDRWRKPSPETGRREEPVTRPRVEVSHGSVLCDDGAVVEPRPLG